jgi:hypothetical protein
MRYRRIGVRISSDVYRNRHDIESARSAPAIVAIHVGSDSPKTAQLRAPRNRGDEHLRDHAAGTVDRPRDRKRGVRRRVAR